MELKIEVTTTFSDLYNYRLNKRYTSLAGILITMAGMLLAVQSFRSENLIATICGVCLIVLIPIFEYTTLKKQVTMHSAMIKPIQYHMDEQGILCTFLDQSTEYLLWNQIGKAASTHSIYFLECSNGRTIILPRREVMNALGEVIGMISKHISPEKVRIRL